MYDFALLAYIVQRLFTLIQSQVLAGTYTASNSSPERISNCLSHFSANAWE